MEISPISAVRIAPVIRSKQSDLGLTGVFEIERSSRADDETYSPGGNKAAGGSEEEESMTGDQEESDSEDEGKPETEKAADEETGEISFFA